MLIYACISAHGFGHGSRCAAVLAELAARRPGWRLVLSTALPPPFLKLAFGSLPYEHRPCRWDVGVIQADALGVDPEATLAALVQREREIPSLLEREARWLEAQAEPTLILGDIPPAAALLAARVGVPLVWLASFGWDAIYEPMGPAFRCWADRCRDLYHRGDLLLHCPLALPMPWGLPEVRLGITSSRPRLDPAAVAARLDLPPDREQCVLISFGGLGLGLDPTWLERWPEAVFIGPAALLAVAPNGRLLPPDLRPLDVMPAVGRLITKPGYSSFCEAFHQRVGIHLVQREGFAEAPVLEAALRAHGRHRVLSAAQFHRGDWELDRPLLDPEQAELDCDGAAVAAAALASQGERQSAVPIVRGDQV